MASQIKLITPAPAIAASERGAAGANVSFGVTQVRGDAGPITTAPETRSTGRTSKQRSVSKVTPLITYSVPATGAGVINLIWDANGEGDLAGYIVLRGEAPGDTLQPVTPEPVTVTSYRDETVRAGTRYVYAVVAVDRAGNRSPESNRAEETARQ